ncbi:MCE family protein [Nocardioides sp. KR10-350]|uniref:MCE family protein n=1 Tax=Nocardioides cheoyonin TaxID=3156615 RepID=UPI0032B38927
MTQTMARTATQPASRPAPRRVTMRSLFGRQRFRVLGVIFLCLLLFAVWLTYAIFTKKFSHYDEITLRTDRIGLQLPDRADVKIRGVLVGEVLDMAATDKGATLKLGIYPSQLDTIPADVTGAILPKTLFGEKYVSLVAPKGATATADSHIEPGAVISKTHVAIELQKVLRDIYPLLRTIQPADLNTTLNAIATALEGRGEKLGTTLETLDSYLKRFNPKVPQLISDLRMASRVSDTYSDALPEIAQILRNSITTATTLESHSKELTTLLTDVTSFSHTADEFLRDNGDNLIELGRVSRPVVGVLARYSPEFPCLLGGLDNLGGRVSEAFRDYTLHITLETLPRQPRGYTTADKPRYGDDRGPACGHLPNPPWSQSNPLTVVPNLNDGIDSPTGKGTDRAPVDYTTGMSYAGSPAETEVLDQLIAPGLGVSAKQVPDLGALLVGPMARGAKVGLN